MNNRSITRWLGQIGLPQYTSEGETHLCLEGLLLVTEDDLRLMGVKDPDHRTTIINQLQKQQQRIQPDKENNSAVMTGTMSRKYSLASSLDLVKPTTDLFHHSIVPRLRRRDNHRVSASCLQLPSHTCDEDHAPSTKHKLRFLHDQI